MSPTTLRSPSHDNIHAPHRSRDVLGQPGPTFPDGSFVFPSTFGLEFASGSYLNASWASKYTNMNLWLSQYHNDTFATSIATSITYSWFNWEIVMPMGIANYSDPFHFHLVDAAGNLDDQATGGIWSTGFFIREDRDASPSPSQALGGASIVGTVTVTSAGPSAATSAANSDIIGPTTATSSLGATTAPTSLASPISMSVVSSQASSMASSSPSSASTSSPPASADDSLSMTAKAGIGVGAAIGALILVAIAAGFLFLARRTRRHREGPRDMNTHHLEVMPPRYDWKEVVPGTGVSTGQRLSRKPLTPRTPQELPAFIDGLGELPERRRRN